MKQMMVEAKVVVVAFVPLRTEEKKEVDVAFPSCEVFAERVVEVAFVVVAFVALKLENSAFVALRTEAKSDVVVALVDVELSAVKFWKVEEANVIKPPQNCEAVDDVAVR